MDTSLLVVMGVFAIGMIIFFIIGGKKKKEMPKRQTYSDNTKKKQQQKTKMFTPHTSSQIMSMFFKDYDEKTGIMKIDDNHYSVCYEYTDISFLKANPEKQKEIFLKYVDYLNSLNLGMHIQVVHCGIPVATNTYKEDYIFPITDKLSENEKKLAEEFNNAIESNLGNKKTTFCETRLIVVTYEADTFETARDLFFQYQMQIEEKFATFNSKIRRWSIEERLQLLYNTFNITPFVLDYDKNESIIKLAEEQGISIYDFLAPKEPIYCREKDFISIDDKKFLKVMYVNKLPPTLTPKFYSKLTTIEANIIVTENISPTDASKTIKRIDKKISGLETERLEKIKKAALKNLNYEYVKDVKLEEKLENQRGLRDALVKKQQKLFKKNTIICIIAKDIDELNLITNKVKTIAGECVVEVGTLDWQQIEGIQNLLPFGYNTLQFQRSLHSEAVAESVPFNSKSIIQKNALYYGVDLVSKSMVCCDRTLLMNGNGCVLATSGAGKSFFTKTNIEQVYLRYPNDEIFILDPQGEYTLPVKALGGQTIEISTTANTYINPFDMELQYVDEDNDPVKTKIEYILAFMESIIGGSGLTGEQESIIDRATKRIYENYEINKCDENKPSFPVMYKELQTYNEPEAKNLVLILERYVQGGMDIFSKDTNVEIKNRIVSFDLHNLTASMQTTGYLVVLEHIMNRVARNKALGRNTWLYIDEFHILLENRYSADYIAKIYKIGRKLGALPTIITQNISDVIQSNQGSKILAVSEFAIILKQKTLELPVICNIFKISPEEAKYCSISAPPGQGLIIYGDDIVPFRNQVPKDSYIYSLNNTDNIQTVRG